MLFPKLCGTIIPRPGGGATTGDDWREKLLGGLAGLEVYDAEGE